MRLLHHNIAATSTALLLLVFSNISFINAQNSVVDLIVNDPELSILESLVVATPGMVETLNALTDITVFAPLDSAFAAVADVDLTPLQIVQVLQYHVLRSEVRAGDITDGLTVTNTILADPLTFQVNATGVFINNLSQVVQADLEASNGVVHKIANLPLLPPTLFQEETTSSAVPSASPTAIFDIMPVTDAPSSSTLGTVVDVAISLDGFSTLVDLVVLAGLDEALATEPRVTVLAPTDDAFAAASLDPSLVAALVTPNYRIHLQQILLYHCFPTILRAGKLLDSYSVRSVGGLYLTTMNADLDRVQFKTPDGLNLNINNGNANVVVQDVLASNGVVHAIDAVLLPSFVSRTVDDTIRQDRRDLRTLYALLMQAGLVDVLAGDGGPFTVFAPIDEAFVGIDPPPTGDALTNILTYHVVAGMYPSTLIEDGLELTTVQGETITFSVTEMGVFLNGNVPIEATDDLAINGIVHKIGGVLLP
jgi:transforming growth factor-beta-induced protein